MDAEKIKKSFTFDPANPGEIRQAQALVALVLQAVHDRRMSGGTSVVKSPKYSPLLLFTSKTKTVETRLEELIQIDHSPSHLTLRTLKPGHKLGSVLTPGARHRIHGQRLREILDCHEVSIPLHLFSGLIGSWNTTSTFAKMLLHPLANEASGNAGWMINVNLNPKRQARAKRLAAGDSIRKAFRNAFGELVAAGSFSIAMEEASGRPHFHGYIQSPLPREQLRRALKRISGMRAYGKNGRNKAVTITRCFNAVGAVLYACKDFGDDDCFSAANVCLSHQAVRQARAHQKALRESLEAYIGRSLSFRGRPRKSSTACIMASHILTGPIQPTVPASSSSPRRQVASREVRADGERSPPKLHEPLPSCFSDTPATPSTQPSGASEKPAESLLRAPNECSGV